MATAITYQSGPKARDLRTVIVENMRRTVVLLPAGRLDVVQASLLHGTSCRHKFWDDVLGTEGDDFVVPAESVRQVREMQIAVKARHK